MNSINPHPPRESREARPDTILGHTGGLLSLLILLVAQAGCTKSRSEPEDILARVGDHAIRESDFRRRWDERRPSTDAPDNRERILEQMIERTALAGAAREAGLLDDPVVVEQVENLLIQRLEETRLAPELDSVRLDDEEVRQEYQRSLESLYTRPARVRVAVLWYDTRNRQPLVDRYTPRLQEALASARNLPVAEGFGATALRCSEHVASRYKGGDLGWIEENSAGSPWHQRVLEIASTLRERGEISPIVADAEGLFVVRLVDRQAAEVRSFESVRAGIEQRLRTQRRLEIAERFRRNLVEQAPVQRYSDRLRSLQNLPTRDETYSHRGSLDRPGLF